MACNTARMPNSLETRPWWKDAVIYQIYPRSFADGNDDGIGDLTGILERIDHLSWLGVDAIWLSPIYPSPMHDFGYDVSNYCDIDPVFGTLDDFDSLVEACHQRNLRVLLDWVPAHTSSEHPWFAEARASRENRRRDWYVWRDPGPNGEVPNNWTSTFTQGAPVWTLDDPTGQLYLHTFLPEQPDLNWANPEVRSAMHDTLRFWLDRGVDGFRADVIHNIGKDAGLANVSEKIAKIPHSALNDDPSTHAYLREIRTLLDGYDRDRMMVGEVFLLKTELVAAYYGQDDELHLSFNFPPMFAPWEAEPWRACIEQAAAVLDPIGAWPTWVLSNHDQKRQRTRYGSEAAARAAAVLLLTLRGTPFLYMGEELGLEDAVVPPERVVDPGGRDGCRAPIPWNATSNHGWGDDPWLPAPPDAGARCADALRQDPDSVLHLYRRLLALRAGSAALSQGDLTLLDAPDHVLGYQRSLQGDERRVWINFSDAPVSLAGEAGGIEVSSDGRGEGARFSGILAPHQAIVVRS